LLSHPRKGAALWLLVTLASLLSLSPLSPSARTAAQGEAPPRPDNPYGVNLFLHKEVEPWKIEKTLQMVAEANIPWIKQEFSWQEIEFRKGYFFDDKWQKSAWEKFDNIVNLAERYGLRVIARVDHPPAWAKADPGTGVPLKDNRDLADFTIALLEHYKGRIKHVQIWNEPNLAGEWNPGGRVDPAGYAEMLKTVYPAVKAAHPDVQIISAPLAMTVEGPELRGNMNEIDYWQGLYAAGVKGNFDIASANGYGLDQPPTAAPDPKVLNFRRVELIRAVMEQNGDGSKPVWFNEFAWNASPETLAPEERNFWRYVTPQQQAQWTVEGVEYARNNWPWAGVLSIWYFRQVGDIPPEKAEYYFGMVNPDFSPQPVYEAVKAGASKYPGPATQGAVPTPVNKPSATPRPPAAATNTRPVQQPTTPPAAPTATTAPTQAPAVTVEATVTTVTDAATATPAGVTTTPTGQVTATGVVTTTITPPSIGPEPTPQPQVAGESGGATILYVLGGLLVLGGLAALGYYLMKGRGTGTAAS
jgi:polysaccharide biosynthesis protein PslG